MNDLISIIVPIYKVEPYLNKCITSILNQTYSNLEIILVDDGSPDNCGIICDEYARKDTRVKVIHKANGGLSDARNAGLDVMQGNYVGFVDSDDWIEPHMFEVLLSNIKLFNAEISCGGVSDDIEIGETIRTVKVSHYGDKDFSESGVEAMRRYFLGSWAAWDKLYKAEIFKGLRYPVGEINEDEAIVLDVLNQCSLVCYTNRICYHYMKRLGQNSITTASFSSAKLIWKDHCAANLKWIQKKYPVLEREAATRYRNSLLWLLTEIALLRRRDGFGHERDVLLEELRDNKLLFDNSIFPSTIEKVKYKIALYNFSLYKNLVCFKREANKLISKKRES